VLQSALEDDGDQLHQPAVEGQQQHCCGREQPRRDRQHDSADDEEGVEATRGQARQAVGDQAYQHLDAILGAHEHRDDWPRQPDLGPEDRPELLQRGAQRQHDGGERQDVEHRRFAERRGEPVAELDDEALIAGQRRRGRRQSHSRHHGQTDRNQAGDQGGRISEPRHHRRAQRRQQHATRLHRPGAPEDARVVLRPAARLQFVVE